MRKPRIAREQPDSFLKQAKKAETPIFADMDALSKKHGRDLFRVVGQRFFKRQHAEDVRRHEIARLEKELEGLKR